MIGIDSLATISHSGKVEGQYFVQHHSKGIDIGALVILLSIADFGAHITEKHTQRRGY
jgi:hypothetical protein